MKIALVTLTRGNVSGGSRKHLQRVVPLLRAHPDVERLDVFMPPSLVRDGEQTWPERDELHGFRELRRSLIALRPDVVFIPNARMLRLPGIPVVTMVRNMEPLEVPFDGNPLVEGVKNVARAMAARAASRRSDRVIAVSEHVRDFLVQRWKIPAAHIGTVYHGVDAPTDDSLVPPATLLTVAGSRFLFTAGSIRPARGLDDLVHALPEVPADVRLVIAGSVDRGFESYGRRIRTLADERGVASRIVWAGQLDARAMSWCFRNAALFVMTSRAEACPNTVLEAMAHGAVSVSTNHAPMPEFFGDGALYYRERDAADLARRLVGALAWNDDHRARMRDAAIARARRYTWDATARATVVELQRALDLRKTGDLHKAAHS
jgi:glycosyltransferase involved in cell wall biosynthesis